MDIDYAFERKPLDNIKPVIDDKVSIMLFKKDNFYSLVGSSAFRLNKNYGDIDVLETVIYEKKSRSGVANKFVKQLRRVIAAIKKKRLSYFTDFKAGIDTRFIIEGYFEYPPSDSARKVSIVSGEAMINYLKKNKLITDAENRMLQGYLKDFTQENFYAFKEFMRIKQVLKWTEAEIMKGSKNLIGGEVMKLTTAVLQDSVVKIDYVTILGDQFIEMSNFLLIGNLTPSGDINIMNRIRQVDDSFIDILKDDINKYMFTKFYLDPLKAIKRMYNLCRVYHSKKKFLDEVTMYMNQLIIPVINGDINFLNRFSSGLSAILLIRGALPKVSVKKYLKLINFELPNCLILSNKDLAFINDHIVKAINTNSNEIIKKSINTIIEYFSNIISDSTSTFLIKKGFDTRESLSIFLPPIDDEEPAYNNIPSDVEITEDSNSVIDAIEQSASTSLEMSNYGPANANIWNNDSSSDPSISISDYSPANANIWNNDAISEPSLSMSDYGPGANRSRFNTDPLSSSLEMSDYGPGANRMASQRAYDDDADTAYDDDADTLLEESSVIDPEILASLAREPDYDVVTRTTYDDDGILSDYKSSEKDSTSIIDLFSLPEQTIQVYLKTDGDGEMYNEDDDPEFFSADEYDTEFYSVREDMDDDVLSDISEDTEDIISDIVDESSIIDLLAPPSEDSSIGPMYYENLFSNDSSSYSDTSIIDLLESSLDGIPGSSQLVTYQDNIPALTKILDDLSSRTADPLVFLDMVLSMTRDTSVGSLPNNIYQIASGLFKENMLRFIDSLDASAMKSDNPVYFVQRIIEQPIDIKNDPGAFMTFKAASFLFNTYIRSLMDKILFEFGANPNLQHNAKGFLDYVFNILFSTRLSSKGSPGYAMFQAALEIIRERYAITGKNMAKIAKSIKNASSIISGYDEVISMIEQYRTKPSKKKKKSKRSN